MTKKELEQKTNAENIFQEVCEAIADVFVATYEITECALIIHIPNGQKFQISVTEIL